jgi:glutathione peroxidase-family protein
MHKITLFFLFSLVGFCQFCIAQEVYQYSANAADGNEISLQRFKGQKMVLVILSPNPADSMHTNLLAFAKRHADSVKIIGLTASVGGKEPTHFDKIKAIYTGSPVILLSPSVLGKAQPTEQTPLLQWLTNSKLNHHFDKDAVEPETRFFIDETGRLYSVLSKHAGWDTPFIRQVLAARPPRSF